MTGRRCQIDTEARSIINRILFKKTKKTTAVPKTVQKVAALFQRTVNAPGSLGAHERQTSL